MYALHWVSRLARVGLTIGLALVLSGIFTGPTQASSETPSLFPVPGADPRTDGTTIVYDAPNNTGTWDIYAVTTANGAPITVSSAGDYNAMYPDTMGGLVVWQQTNAGGDFDILGRYLDKNTTFTIAGGDRNQVYPVVFGDAVVYVSAAHTYSPDAMQYLELTDVTGTNSTKLDEVPVGNGSGGFLRPAIAGKRVAWVRTQDAGDHVIHWQLKTQLLSDNSPTIVAEGNLDIGGPLGLLSTPAYDVTGDMLVYTDDLRLTVVDLSTGQQTELINSKNADYAAAQNPTIDGQYVFWQDYRSYGITPEVISALQSGNLQSDLMGYDLQTGSEFVVVPHTAYSTSPFARGEILTFEQEARSGEGATTVHATTISQALPTAPRPDLGDPNVSYYPETGHALSGAFREFWTQSGGLPVFGYPLTEVFTEHGVVTQYLERQRFEAHPEFDGTPYMVELGRLGAEDAAMRGLTTTQPFQPLPATTKSDANCEFFAVTGHRLCFGFKTYWQSHGLDFGDPGISVRESVALFGYPISEEFVDPQSGLVVQYFERARLEYHPDNPDPYKVEVGRLAADVLIQRGW